MKPAIRTLAILLVGIAGGCAIRATQLRSGVMMTVGRDPALDAQCAGINRRYIAFTATGVGLAAAGGATGIPAMLTTDTPRWVTGSISAVTAAGAAIFTTLGTLEAQAYARSCAVEVTGGK